MSAIVLAKEEVGLFDSEDDCELIVWGDHLDFKDVTEEGVEETSRWSVFYSKVVQHTPTGDYYEVSWEVGATEYQDTDLNFTVRIVEPYQETVTKYRPIKKET